MKVRIDPIAGIVLAIILGWGFTEVVTEDPKPICQVEEVHDGKKVLVPYFCEDILKGAEEI